jgi:NADP-dependent 3-hydroxy acid dehydrogenase YdfG
MQASDIASLVWNALQMSPSAVVEEIIIRPQLGDL